jgi:hypothetical protein
MINPLTLTPRRHPGLYLALAVYLFLALSWFFITPIFEGPDEWTHTGHVKYIADGHGLPVMLPGQGIWGGQQPPLYYVGGALLVQPFSLGGLDNYLAQRLNPHSSLGYALDPGNKNNYLHGPDEAFPWRGLPLAVHLLRLYSMLFGVATLIFIYLTAYEISDLRFTIYDFGIPFRPSPAAPSPAQPGRFATPVPLFVAVQPMFSFITALVANEPANIAACALAIWLAQRYLIFGPAPRPWRALALGLAIALAALSKMTGLAVGLAAVLAFLYSSIATRKISGAARLLWRDGLIIGLIFLAVAGWWYGRNYLLYGDFFQRGLYKIYFGVDPQPLTLSQFIYTLRTGEISFWATFGWLNIVAPDGVYTVYRVISRVGLIGVAIGMLLALGRKSGRASLGPLLLHLAWPVSLAFSLTRLVATEGGMQGRQLLPALGSMAIVIIWGWAAILPARLRAAGLAVLLAGLTGLAIWLPYGVAAAEYTPRPLLTEADLPAGLPRLDWAIGDGEMELVAATIDTAAARPGARVPVTLYWPALRPMSTNYSVFVHLFGRGGASVGQFNSYPGLGLRPTTSLQPGQIVVDTYPVQLEGGSEAPTQLRVTAGLYDFHAPGRPGLPVVASDGQPVTDPTIGQLKLIPAQWPPRPPAPPG